jgi:hypothetical protein
MMRGRRLLGAAEMALVKSDDTQRKSNAPLQFVASNSSWIAAFEYDQANMRLTAHLKDGSIYQHTFVTSLDWDALRTSKNHSQHWSRAIKGKKLAVKIRSAKSPTASIKLGGRK